MIPRAHTHDAQDRALTNISRGILEERDAAVSCFECGVGLRGCASVVVVVLEDVRRVLRSSAVGARRLAHRAERCELLRVVCVSRQTGRDVRFRVTRMYGTFLVADVDHPSFPTV